VIGGSNILSCKCKYNLYKADVDSNKFKELVHLIYELGQKYFYIVIF
jgi:hypothetical protein